MKINLLSRLIVAIGIGAICVAAQAKNEYAGMTERQIDKELAAVISKGRQMDDLTQLKAIGTKIFKAKRCTEYRDIAIDSRSRLIKLNRKYRNGADREYQRQEQALRRRNANAISNYQRCFNDEIRRLRLTIPEKGIVDYASFKPKFESLAVQLQGESSAELRKRAEGLYAAKQQLGKVTKFPIGTVIASKGQVALTRTDVPLKISNGINVSAGDTYTIRDGRVELEFTEVVGTQKRGPVRLSIGPNTKMTIGWTSNMVVQDRRTESIVLDISLIYGTVRLTTIGAGFDSSYQIRSGRNKTQLLGGDTVVSTYPKRNLVNTKLNEGVAEVSFGSTPAVRLGSGQQLTIREGRVRPVTTLPSDQWSAAKIAAGSQRRERARDNASRRRVTKPIAGGGKVARQDIRRRARARDAVDQMLIALRSTDANGLLSSTSGEARRNARNSMRNLSLSDVLRRSGRPVTWFHDCVACTPDGYCAVPTEVKLDGGPSRQYEAVHIVAPGADNRSYTVNRIDPWNESTKGMFRGNKPLCAADLR